MTTRTEPLPRTLPSTVNPPSQTEGDRAESAESGSADHGETRIPSATQSTSLPDLTPEQLEIAKCETVVPGETGTLAGGEYAIAHGAEGEAINCGAYARGSSEEAWTFLTGVDRYGNHIGMHSVNESGEVSLDAEGLNLRFTNEEEIVTAFQLDDSRRTNEHGEVVYTRSGFEGEYIIRDTHDGQKALLYFGGSVGNDSCPPQVFANLPHSSDGALRSSWYSMESAEKYIVRPPDVVTPAEREQRLSMEQSLENTTRTLVENLDRYNSSDMQYDQIFEREDADEYRDLKFEYLGQRREAAESVVSQFQKIKELEAYYGERFSEVWKESFDRMVQEYRNEHGGHELASQKYMDAARRLPYYDPSPARGEDGIDQWTELTSFDASSFETMHHSNQMYELNQDLVKLSAKYMQYRERGTEEELQEILGNISEKQDEILGMKATIGEDFEQIRRYTLLKARQAYVGSSSGGASFGHNPWVNNWFFRAIFNDPKYSVG